MVSVVYQTKWIALFHPTSVVNSLNVLPVDVFASLDTLEMVPLVFQSNLQKNSLETVVLVILVLHALLEAANAIVGALEMDGSVFSILKIVSTTLESVI